MAMTKVKKDKDFMADLMASKSQREAVDCADGNQEQLTEEQAVVTVEEERKDKETERRREQIISAAEDAAFNALG